MKTRTSLTLLLPVVLGLSLMGCSSEPELTPLSPLPKVGNTLKAKTLWSGSIGNGVGEYYSQLSPVVAGERLFAASRDGILAAYDKETGKRQWQPAYRRWLNGRLWQPLLWL